MALMRHASYIYKVMNMCGLTVALAIVLVFIPGTIWGGGYTTDPSNHSGPRWSNDLHHEEGLIVGRDCVALPPGASAEYIPGRDAWGRTIIPAEQPRGLHNSFPVEVEIDILLKQKTIAGKNIDITAYAMPYIEQSFRLRDCLSTQK